MHKEQLRSYIKENFPKKTYKYSIRPRKPGEIFIGEILVALFLVFMLIMLYLNYESNQKYQLKEHEKNITQIEVDIDIVNEKNLDNCLVDSQFFRKRDVLFEVL